MFVSNEEDNVNLLKCMIMFGFDDNSRLAILKNKETNQTQYCFLCFDGQQFMNQDFYIEMYHQNIQVLYMLQLYNIEIKSRYSILTVQNNIKIIVSNSDKLRYHQN